LFRLARYSIGIGANTNFIDVLSDDRNAYRRRERVDVLDLDRIAVSKWRFGESAYSFVRKLSKLRSGRWMPDRVYVLCGTTFWWEGAAEAIAAIKRVFPSTRVVLVGAYPDLAPHHAADHSKADIVARHLDSKLEPAVCLDRCANPPSFVYISLGGGARTAQDVLDEVTDKAERLKVRHFAFAEHAVASRFPALYREVLEKLIDRRLAICFYALGNIAPADLADAPDLAGLMRQAGFKQIYFADDRDEPDDPVSMERLVEAYRGAAVACHLAGFPPRTDALTATVCLGRAGEDLAGRARLATLAAHHLGAVIFVPYQPAPAECPDLPLEAQNGKLFPLRHRNGHTYREYLDVMGLGVVLNAKHRERTFDFLGDGLVARLFRDSLDRRAWDPDPAVKGSLRLPALERR
jgi:hypothetical protein